MECSTTLRRDPSIAEQARRLTSQMLGRKLTFLAKAEFKRSSKASADHPLVNGPVRYILCPKRRVNADRAETTD